MQSGLGPGGAKPVAAQGSRAPQLRAIAFCLCLLVITIPE